MKSLFTVENTTRNIGDANVQKTRCNCWKCEGLPKSDRKVVEAGAGFWTMLSKGWGVVSEDCEVPIYSYHGSPRRAEKVGNSTITGSQKSPEIEFCWATDNARLRKCFLHFIYSQKGWSVERDGSVYNEYGAGAEIGGYISEKANGLRKLFATLEGWVSLGVICFPRCCGTHLNISTDILRDTLGRYSHSKCRRLFQPIVSLINSDNENTERLFGRIGNEYSNGYGTEGHGVPINLEHLFEDEGTTKDLCRIEFRIMKFNGDDADRYFDTMKKLVKFVDAFAKIYDNATADDTMAIWRKYVWEA